MDKWEYRCYQETIDLDSVDRYSIQNDLNKLGKNG